ncbi:MAG TPA: 5-formyltetrahydrofolate cyclo-ligase [Tepidisphaeraceae bacterium]|jgi:5-formyltetrahydrofolate cyclo-ligase|nr:5-formyltetrahydrofolate cyclo-ligase [Tepidisphaeraceae bacterium]
MAEISSGGVTKAAIRKQLKEKLEAMSVAERHAKSIGACSLVTASPEFAAAQVVMLYLSMGNEVDTAPLALRCWQAGKTVVVPKVSWDQRRMLPTEISSLTTGMTTTGAGVREPISGMPMPVGMIDLVIVPGMGFTECGHRIGRGMGFYDRFLGQGEFLGLSCGLGFEEQIVSELPMMEHDMALSMLVTDRGIRRFATNCIQK